MPSPIGHSLVSLGVYYFLKNRIGGILQEWKMIIFVLIMGNLPDLDFIPGILTGDLSKYHETYSHTLGFAIIVSFLVWIGSFIFRAKDSYKLAFLSFILLCMHVILDALNMDSRPPAGIMIFWPFTDKYFYIRTSLFYPFDRHNLWNFFSLGNLFALITELLIGVPFLVLGVISTKVNKWWRMIIYGLVLFFLLYVLSNLTIDKSANMILKSDIKEKLKGHIVFNSDMNGMFQIYVISTNGKNPKQLTNGNGENFSPSWSPDGKRVVFVSTRDGNKEIYVMDKKGNRQERLTFDISGDIDPVWMPDGKQILFVSDRNGTANFYTVDINGENLKMITQFTSGESNHPSVSGRGDKIIYTSNRDISWQIYSFDIISKHIERLTNPPNGNCDPDISHDGEKILYAGRFGIGNSDIWIMDSNGENKQRLISHPALDYNPKFSPDNKYVVFNSERDGNWNLYILEIESGNIVKLTDNKGYNDRPDWIY